MVARLAPLAALAALALGSSPAFAHDVWLTLPSGAMLRQVHIHYGHTDDLQMPQSDKLVELRVNTTASDRVVATKLTPSKTAPVLETDPIGGTDASLISARYDNGFWVKAADGEYRNTTRRFLPGATGAISSVKFAKLVTGAGAPYATPLGHELELVPLDDPMAVRPGGKLRVRVLFRGQPIAGAEVARSDGETVVAETALPRFKADAQGVVTIPIEKAGGEVLSVTRRATPSVTPDIADADTYSATLAFSLDGPRTN